MRKFCGSEGMFTCHNLKGSRRSLHPSTLMYSVKTSHKDDKPTLEPPEKDADQYMPGESPVVMELSVKENVSKKGSQDPLRWFGLFVPPQLKSAQADFKLTINDDVPALINLEHGLRDLEEKVTMVRGQIKSLHY